MQPNSRQPRTCMSDNAAPQKTFQHELSVRLLRLNADGVKNRRDARLTVSPTVAGPTQIAESTEMTAALDSACEAQPIGGDVSNGTASAGHYPKPKNRILGPRRGG